MRHALRVGTVLLAVFIMNLLAAIMPTPARAEAQAQTLEAQSHTQVTAAYPRHGEGLISLTRRICGSSSNWRGTAAMNRVYGPAFVIYYGHRYLVPCTRVSTTTSRSTTRVTTVSAAWTSPVLGAVCISGYRTSSRPNHLGIDLPRPSGTPIRAIAAGKVALVRYQGGGAGWYVMLNHGTYQTVYMHMRAKSFLSVGARVRPGQTIGFVGMTGNATGPHLHFEVHKGAWHRINPASFLRAHGVAVRGC